MKHVALVVGHTRLRKGACGMGLPCEWDYNAKVATKLTDIADVYYYDSYNLGYKSMVKRNANKLNQKNYKLVLELHYNKAEDIDANGCEVYYYFKNNTGRAWANTLSKQISSSFNITNRGAKAMYSKNQRGFWALYYPKATTLLVEPFFGSNPYDAYDFRESETHYAYILRKFIKNYVL